MRRPTLLVLTLFFTLSCTLDSMPPGYTPSARPSPSLAPPDSTPPPADAPLLGINRLSLEYDCTQYGRFIDGPVDQASVNAMLAWKINTVRLPLNEDCFLGINGVNSSVSGVPYRDFVTKYVRLLNANGLRVVLDLHHAAPGDHLAVGQEPAPDADHALTFWTAIATQYAHNPLIYLDLGNEVFNLTTDCYLHGCQFTTADYGKYLPNYGTYQTVGFQTLIDSIRSLGFHNPLLIAGNQWGNDMTAFHLLKDPDHALLASFHVYDGFNKDLAYYVTRFEAFKTSSSSGYVLSEIGEYDCSSTFDGPIEDWADQHHVGYLAWGWIVLPASKCTTDPTLISDWNGTPTPYGAGLRAHLLTLAGSGKFAA